MLLTQRYSEQIAGVISCYDRVVIQVLLHGLIKRVAGTHKYYLTKLGKTVITTGLKTRALFIIPNLAGIEVAAG